MKLFTTLAAAGVTAFAVLLPAAADDTPLNIFSVPFWKEFPVVREASAADIAKPARALYLELHDMDDFNECAIFVNDLGPLDPPADCLSDSDNMPGMIELPAGWLRAGDNKISFYRTGDCNGSTKGFTVNNVKLLFASNRSGLEKQYEELKKKLPLPSGLMSYSRPLAIRNTFIDNFNDCAPGSEFPYWMNMRGDWQVVERDGEKFISCVKAASESQLLLHVYGQDSTFSGRFRVDSATKESGLYILGRCNAYPDWMVRAGYDYSRGVWQIAESFHVQRNYDFPGVAPEPGVPSPGTMNRPDTLPTSWSVGDTAVTLFSSDDLTTATAPVASFFLTCPYPMTTTSSSSSLSSERTTSTMALLPTVT